MTWINAMLRVWQADAEGREIFDAEMSGLEIREELCRNLIARAKAGDKQADVDLRVLAILYLESAIAGRGDAAAPGTLLGYVRDVLESGLPYDKNYLSERQIQIATAVDMVMAKLPDILATRNQAAAPRSTRNRRARWSPKPSRTSNAGWAKTTSKRPGKDMACAGS